MIQKIRKAIVFPLKEYKIMKESNARKMISNKSDEFLSTLVRCQEVVEKDKIKLIGIGNSITGGWTAINNNVQPLMEKLNEYILDRATQREIDIEILSFPLISHNANKNIYRALESNLTLTEIKKISSIYFDEWKNKFKNTPFENYVDKKEFLKFYPGGNKGIKEIIQDNAFTLSHFNGCTGALIANPKNSIISHKTRNMIIAEELEYLKKIIEYLYKTNPAGIVTVGNFPNISTPIGYILNPIIKRFNEKIESKTLQSNALYFNQNTLQGIQQFNNKLKLDNHPSLDEQYTSLYNYMNFVINNLYSECKKRKELSKRINR